jgi:hypothetical protein
MPPNKTATYFLCCVNYLNRIGDFKQYSECLVGYNVFAWLTALIIRPVPASHSMSKAAYFREKRAKKTFGLLLLSG